jgi:hypothetical protein
MEAQNLIMAVVGIFTVLAAIGPLGWIAIILLVILLSMFAAMVGSMIANVLQVAVMLIVGIIWLLSLPFSLFRKKVKP